MSLKKCLRKHTNRELNTWRAWWSRELNNPDRLDHYIMALRADVVRGYVKEPSRIEINDMKLKFRTEHREPTEKLSEDEIAARSKAAWLGAAGGSDMVRRVKEEDWDEWYAEQVAKEKARLEGRG